MQISSSTCGHCTLILMVRRADRWLTSTLHRWNCQRCSFVRIMPLADVRTALQILCIFVHTAVLIDLASQKFPCNVFNRHHNLLISHVDSSYIGCILLFFGVLYTQTPLQELLIDHALWLVIFVNDNAACVTWNRSNMPTSFTDRMS